MLCGFDLNKVFLLIFSSKKPRTWKHPAWTLPVVAGPGIPREDTRLVVVDVQGYRKTVTAKHPGGF